MPNRRMELRISKVRQSLRNGEVARGSLRGSAPRCRDKGQGSRAERSATIELLPPPSKPDARRRNLSAIYLRIDLKRNILLPANALLFPTVLYSRDTRARARNDKKSKSCKERERENCKSCDIIFNCYLGQNVEIR